MQGYLSVIVMEHFTPIASLAGGILIGLSAAAMLLLNGKITGISGILAGVLRPVKADTLWRACFIGGLVVGGVILRALLPSAFDFGTVLKGAEVGSFFCFSEAGVKEAPLLGGVFVVRGGKLGTVNHQRGGNNDSAAGDLHVYQVAISQADGCTYPGG